MNSPSTAGNSTQAIAPMKMDAELAGFRNMYAPSVLNLGTTKRMWLCGWKTDLDLNNFLHAANSRADLTQVYGPDKIWFSDRSAAGWGAPQLSFQKLGYHVCDPSVIRPPSTSGVDRSRWLYMFYTALDNRSATSATLMVTKNVTGFASSIDDGRTWTDHGIIIDEARGGDEHGAWAASALVAGNEIWLYYHTGSQDFSRGATFRQRLNANGWQPLAAPQALSFPEGISFNAGTKATLLSNLDVYVQNGSYYLLGNTYSGKDIVRFQSSDGIRWVKAQADPILIHGGSNGIYTPHAEVLSADSIALRFGYAPSPNPESKSIQSWSFTFKQPPLPTSTLIEKSLDVAAFKMNQTANYISTHRTATEMLPRSTQPDGSWKMVGPTTATDWVAGFYPGVLWQMYRARGTGLQQARTFTSYLANVRAPKNGNPTHGYTHGNLGFDMKNSFMLQLQLAPGAADEAASRAIVHRAAADLAGLYNEKAHAILEGGQYRYPDYKGYLLVDYLMNLEPLFWSAKNGGPLKHRTIAIEHAKTILAQNVRADGSTFHHVLYNNAGQPFAKKTHQGYSDNSTWARGQAWTIYGFTMVYRETGDPRFYQAARATADYFIARLPASSITPWDFDAPAVSGRPLDTSATAIATSAMIELAYLSPTTALREKYLNQAERQLRALMLNHTNGPNDLSLSILKNGTGHKPHESEVEVGLIYGDFYYLEALNRFKKFKATGANPN